MFPLWTRFVSIRRRLVLRLSNLLNRHGGRDVKGLYFFSRQQGFSFLVDSLRSNRDQRPAAQPRTRPYIVAPHNAYTATEPHALCSMQYTCIFTMSEHGSKQKPMHFDIYALLPYAL